MESLLTLIEDNPLLKKWVNLCRIEQNMHKLSENLKSNIANETGVEISVPSDISKYGADFATINENIKTLKALRNEENSLKQEIAKLEVELENARKKRKNIIIASVVGVIILIIVLISVI
jgi:hypothetical protein